MALRTTTVEYVFPTHTTGLAANTRLDFAAITLFIPETTSRTFRSCIIEVTHHDNAATAASATNWLLGIKLGAAVFSDVTVTDTITNSAEHQSNMFTRDVFSYFNTNFGAGASQTCQVGVQWAGLTTQNITAKLIITYEWDDAAQTTRVKTVRVPLDSPVAALTTTLANQGTNQIPALDTFLPESTKVYRRIWFEFMGNNCQNGTTPLPQLGFRVDAAEAETLSGAMQAALNSAIWFKFIWVKEDFTTNAVHNLQMRTTSTTTAPFNHIGILLCVTYEYDHAVSTSIMNSIMLPYEIPSPLGRTVAADRDRFRRTFFVPEPATIALAQSGILFRFNVGATMTPFLIAVGGQTARSYTHVAGALTCGQFTVTHRFDSGAAAGSGLTIARGLNTITLDFHTTSTVLGTNLGGMIYLNYTSGKASAGASAHTHTTIWNLLDTVADATVQDSVAAAPNIPETNWWATSVGYKIHMVPTAASAMTIVFAAEVQAGEAEQDGWRDLYADSYGSDPENGLSTIYVRARDDFQRWPSDSDSKRLLLETAREYRAHFTTLTWHGFYMYVTYHSITFDITGTISGSSGGTVNIRAFWTGGEQIGTTSRAGNGVYTIPWYEDTETKVVTARESATLVGASDEAAI